MEDLVNISLDDVIKKERAKCKQNKKQTRHVKTKKQHHDKPKKEPAKQSKRKNEQTPKEGKRRLLIKNLHLEADNTVLINHFKQFGKMTWCGVHWDPYGKSKGTALVEYEAAPHATKALKKSNGAELVGQAVEVVLA